MEVESIAHGILKRANLNIKLKEKQLDALKLIFKKKDVFCVLPTGYGKSIIFWLLAAMMDEIEHKEGHITMVVCPLRSLMKDQVESCKAHFSCVAILQRSEMTEEEILGVQRGSYQLIFTSPEAITEPFWFKWLKELRKNICALVFDEAHCIVTWAETFRPEYKRVAEIRAVLGNVPVLATTATATESMIHDIAQSVGIPQFETVAKVPNRENIYLEFGPKPSNICHVQWYIDLLVQDQENTPKALLFCRSITQVTQVYHDFGQLTDEQGVDDDLIDMYHSKLDEATKKMIEEDFRRPDSSRRILITTIAYGMGVQVSDIKYAMHWGPPHSLFDYWQEVGRCARGTGGGSVGHAIMYFPPNSVSKALCNEGMLDLAKEGNTRCFRLAILQALRLNCMPQTEIDSCCGGDQCCSTCNASNAIHKEP